MSAVIAAVVVAGAAIYSGMEKQKAAKKALKYSNNELDRKRQYELERVQSQQRSPAAQAAPILAKFGIGEVFSKAFAGHGMNLPSQDIINAMGLDRIIANNAAGRPWDEGSQFSKYDANIDAENRQIGAQNAAMRREANRNLTDVGGGSPEAVGVNSPGFSEIRLPNPELGTEDIAPQDAPSYVGALNGEYGSVGKPDSYIASSQGYERGLAGDQNA